MSKKKPTGKPVGRPRLNLPIKPRHFLQVERNPEFDADLETARVMIAGLRSVPVESISQSEAVRIALAFYGLDKQMAIMRGQTLCPRCNGLGYLAIKNGDDDQPCPECAK